MSRRKADRGRGGFAMVAALITAGWLLAGVASAGNVFEPLVPTAEELSSPTSYLEGGFLWNSVSDYRFGDYSGLYRDGFYGIGNVDIIQRSEYDAELPYYYRVRGLNLGLESRYAEGEYKWPGLFGLNLFYDSLPKFRSDADVTFMRNTHDTFLMLPSGWVLGNDPTDLTALDSSLHDMNIELQRRTFGAGGEVVLPLGIEFDADYSRQSKEGRAVVGLIFGTSGGNPRSFLGPEQIDYVTHQVDSRLRWANERFQVQVGYYGSFFENEHDYTRWENPFLPAGGWPDRGPDGYPLGQKGQMPDNMFNQILASGGVNLPCNSRFTLNTAFGWAHQDDDYLPYTINPNIATPIGLPRNSLDGELQTRLITAQFLTNPLPKLHFKAKYRWSDRDNKTPVEAYHYVPGDVGDQVGMDEGRLNWNYSFEQHNVDVEIAYDVFRRTKFTALYDWDRRERDLQEVERNDEHTFGFKLVSNTLSFLTGGARYERSYRTGSSYDCVRPLHESEAVPDPMLGCPDESGTGLEYENHPLMRKYYMTDRVRDEVHSWINVMPIESLSIGFDTRWYHDDYNDATYGLQSRRSIAPGVDVTWFPLEWLSLHAFYNYEKFDSHQDSISWSNDGNAFDVTRRWSVETKDTFHTVGVGFDVEAIPNRLGIGVDYLYAKSRGEIDADVGTSLGPLLPFPDLKTELQDISVHADLRITRNFSTRIGYLYEMFDSTDWAVDGVCPGCMNFSGNATVIGYGGSSPDYDAHVISWSLKYEFW